MDRRMFLGSLAVLPFAGLTSKEVSEQKTDILQSDHLHRRMDVGDWSFEQIPMIVSWPPSDVGDGYDQVSVPLELIFFQSQLIYRDVSTAENACVVFDGARAVSTGKLRSKEARRLVQKIVVRWSALDRKLAQDLIDVLQKDPFGKLLCLHSRCSV